MTQFRIAEFTKYGDLAASTRQRFDQYHPFLAELGFSWQRLPLLGNSYLRRAYQGQRSNPAYLVSRYLKRLFRLIEGDFDLLWIHCELFPYLPQFAESLVGLARAPVVFDFDDAIFHNYDQHSNVLVRRLLGGKLAPLLRNSDAAFCGNAYLREYASRYCDDTYIIPTVLDAERYRPIAKRHKLAGEPTIIGWLGSPSTWKSYMVPQLPMLCEEALQANAEIFAVGGGNETTNPRLRVEVWQEADEVSQLQSMDIGIMPLDDSLWARGKCGYKLIQYMACGLPVVASPVGVNAAIVEHGVNGFLATTEEEWRVALQALLHDPDLRRRMGEAGRKKVEREFSIQAYGPKVASILRELAEQGRRRAS